MSTPNEQPTFKGLVKDIVVACVSFAILWPVIVTLSGFLDKPPVYEYKVETYLSWWAETQAKQLNDQAKLGWEFVGVERGFFYFRRVKH
jgi:hypothetical protein